MEAKIKKSIQEQLDLIDSSSMSNATKDAMKTQVYFGAQAALSPLGYLLISKDFKSIDEVKKF